jgi:hypothetical protein
MVSDQPIAREELERYLQVHRPEKVGRVDRILAQYEGRHQQLRQELFDKYGADVGGVQVAGGGWHAKRSSSPHASTTHQMQVPSDEPILSYGADSFLDPEVRPQSETKASKNSQSNSWKIPWQSNKPSDQPQVPHAASADEGEVRVAIQQSPANDGIPPGDAQVLQENHEWVDKLGGLYATGVSTNQYADSSLEMRKCYFTLALFLVLCCMVGVLCYAVAQASIQ